MAGGGCVNFSADKNEDQGFDHLNFKLSSGIQSLALYDANVNQLDCILHFDQTTDVSQGRSPDGAAYPYQYFTIPTPGVANTTPTSVANLASSLRITEVMYNPSGSSDAEFIELQNISATLTLDLTGVRIGGGVSFTFPATTLAPGQYVVIVRHLRVFLNTYGPGINVAGQYDGNLEDHGENLILQLPDPYDSAILRFDYDNIWYPGTDHGGYALEIRNTAALPATWDDPTAWQAGTVLNGSPGRADNGTISLDHITISGNLDAPAESDVIRLVRDTVDPTLLDVFITEAGATPTYSVPFALLHGFDVKGLGGDDRLVLDCSHGQVVPPEGIAYDGGDGTDSLVFTGTAATDSLTVSATQVLFGTLAITNSGVEGVQLGDAGSDLVLDTLTISGSGKATAAAGTGTVLRLNKLVMDGTATLDLADNGMVIQSDASHKASVLSDISTWIGLGRSGGTWSGHGIVTSKVGNPSVDPNGIATLIAIVNDDGGGNVVRSSLGGETGLNTNMVLVKFGYAGDTNMDNVVDAKDYFMADRGYRLQSDPSTKGFANGDFDYSGSVTADDFYLIDRAFIHQNGTVGMLQIAGAQVQAADSGFSSLALAAPADQTPVRAASPSPFAVGTSIVRKEFEF